MNTFAVGAKRTFRTKRLDKAPDGMIDFSVPRKKIVQPSPLKAFALPDGTQVEVRNWDTRERGRGLDKQFLSEELDWQVLGGLYDDLQSGDSEREERAKNALTSNRGMDNHLNAGGYELDERTGRRHGASIRRKYEEMERIRNAVNASDQH